MVMVMRAATSRVIMMVVVVMRWTIEWWWTSRAEHGWLLWIGPVHLHERKLVLVLVLVSIRLLFGTRAVLGLLVIVSAIVGLLANH